MPNYATRLISKTSAKVRDDLFLNRQPSQSLKWPSNMPGEADECENSFDSPRLDRETVTCATELASVSEEVLNIITSIFTGGSKSQL